jgi:hypothetical protein
MEWKMVDFYLNIVSRKCIWGLELNLHKVKFINNAMYVVLNCQLHFAVALPSLWSYRYLRGGLCMCGEGGGEVAEPQCYSTQRGWFLCFYQV